MAVTAGITGAVATVGSAALNASKSSGGGSAADAAGQQATDYAQQAESLWQNLTPPTYNTTPLQGETWQQDYTPVNYDPYIGQMTQMSDDPAALAAQNQALSQLQTLSQGGLSPSDMLALEQIQQQQASAASSANQTSMAQMQARGVGGAGAGYATQLAGNQGAANTAQTSYSNAMQTAMQRQLAAIQGAGTLAGGIRSESANISNSMANIANQFNTQVQNLRTTAAQSAANNANAAQQYNLTGRQGVANTNVATANTNLQYQNQLLQNTFGNQSTILQGETNALNKQQALASANQAALATQATGQTNSQIAGLNSLAGAAQTASQPNSWLDQLVGGTNSTPITSDSNQVVSVPGEDGFTDPTSGFDLG